jgi:hypothetical protein
MNKSLSDQKARALLESFNRQRKDIEIYEVSTLTELQRRDLLKGDHVWIVVGRSQWT